MSDPFSVAGSAVGVISLGLTACQGFLAYYGPYKSFHEEIKDVTTQMEALICILKALQNLIAKASILNVPSMAESTQIANSTIVSCQSALQRLHKTLDRCYASRRSGILATAELKAHVNRSLYPFRRETLISLIENVSWLRDNLNISLQMLQISLTIIAQGQMHSILSNSASIASNTGQMAGALQRLDHKITTVDDSLVMLERRLDQIESYTIASKTQLIPNPGFLKSLLDTQHDLDRDLKGLSTRVYAQGPRPRTRCKCPCRYPIPDSAYIEREYVPFHKDGCPFNIPGRRVINLAMKRKICNRLFGFSVLACLQITFGAGGLAISPKLEFQPVVSKDSPAFTLLRSAEQSFNLGFNKSVIQDTHKMLFELFREGKASPSDTLPNGETILHILTGWQCYTCRWDARLWEDWRRFINALLDAGLSPSRIDCRGTTSADNMIYLHTTYNASHGEPSRESATIAICSDILRAGGYMTYNALDCRHRSNYAKPLYTGLCRRLFQDHTIRLIWLLEDRKDIQDINLPDELVPLITRSKDQLFALLKEGLNMQPWIGSYTQWPTGLSVLLQAGYNPSRDSFRHACEADCKASVQVLIHNGKFLLGPDELRISSVHHNQEIVQLIIQVLADRRKRLQSLAVDCLPRGVLAQLRIRSDSLLNLKAAEAFKLLRLHSIKVDDIEEEYEWSVYDALGLNLSIADRLWNAGFQDVDEVNKYGVTSLMKLEYSELIRYGPIPLLERAYWLITKGSDPYRKKSSSPALHFLGRAIGHAISALEENKDVRSELSRLDEGCRNLLWSIFCDDTRDSCDCACSTNGCCGLTRVLHGLFRRRHRISTESLVKISITIEFLASSLEPKLQDSFYDQLAPGILRFLTFRMLDITHTCSHSFRNIDPEEVNEIHYEEKYLICTLERLLDEFAAEYEKSTETLPEFLTGSWWTRINETVSAHEPPTQQELNQILETGVVLEA